MPPSLPCVWPPCSPTTPLPPAHWLQPLRPPFGFWNIPQISPFIPISRPWHLPSLLAGRLFWCSSAGPSHFTQVSAQMHFMGTSFPHHPTQNFSLNAPTQPYSLSLSFSAGTAIFTLAVLVGHSGVMVRAQGFTGNVEYSLNLSVLGPSQS